MTRARVAVVGHVELVEFVPVPRLPTGGEILHTTGPAWQEAGGGGGVAAVALARLGGAASLFTALGDDVDGARARELLAVAGEPGLEVHAATRAAATRRAVTLIEPSGERTILVLAQRMVPAGGDALPWKLLAGCDAVYFTGGDVEALRAARAAGVLTATARAADVLIGSGVELDVLVASARDPGEQLKAGALSPPPRVTVRTDGERGGSWESAAGQSGRWDAAALPGSRADAYGCGDWFAAALTLELARGATVAEACEAGARAGAHCLSLHGPYGR